MSLVRSRQKEQFLVKPRQTTRANPYCPLIPQNPLHCLLPGTATLLVLKGAESIHSLGMLQAEGDAEEAGVQRSALPAPGRGAAVSFLGFFFFFFFTTPSLQQERLLVSLPDSCYICLFISLAAYSVQQPRPSWGQPLVYNLCLNK